MKNTHILGLIGLSLGLANVGLANVEIKINEANPEGAVIKNGQFSHQLPQTQTSTRSQSATFREEIKINENNPTGEVKKYTSAPQQNTSSQVRQTTQPNNPWSKNIRITENTVTQNTGVTQSAPVPAKAATPTTSAPVAAKPAQTAPAMSQKPTVSQYIGDIKNGQATGKGTLVYSNGDRYVGDVVNGVPNGIGTLYNKSGQAISRGKFTPISGQ